MGYHWVSGILSFAPEPLFLDGDVNKEKVVHMVASIE